MPRLLRRPLPGSPGLFEWRLGIEAGSEFDPWSTEIIVQVYHRARVAGHWRDVEPDLAQVRVYVTRSGERRRYVFREGEPRTFTARAAYRQ